MSNRKTLTSEVSEKWLGLCYIKIKMRKDLLVNGGIYHIFTRSIADFKIFNGKNDFERMRHSMKYYLIYNELRFSDFMELKVVHEYGLNKALDIISKDKDSLVQIVAYCLMPTHIHFILKQLSENGISDYMRKILDSYTRYFNTIHKRKGPLWEGKFKNVLVKDDEQLVHLTRYVHLNPVTVMLVDRPEDWIFSSYKEYLLGGNNANVICQFDDILEITPLSYRKFVNDRISYQRELAKIKKLTID